MAQKIEVNVVADVNQFKRGLDQVNGQLEGFSRKAGKVGSALKGMLAGAAVAAGGAALGSVLKDSITAASDLNETVSKTKTIFGPASAEILKFGETAAKSLGMSKEEALAGASTFGNFFDQIGIGAQQSVEMSKGFVQMSTDLGSFNNAAPVEVMEALASATRGEYDALQRFIPTVNAAAVQQKAMSMTGKDAADALTEADKAAALYTLTQEGMGAAAGDFARTSEGMANQQRILNAQWADAKAKLGEQLLPIVTKLFNFMNDTGIPAISAVATWFRDTLGPEFENTGTQAGVLSEKFQAVITWLQELWQKHGPALTAAFVQIAAAVISMWQQAQPIIQLLKTTFNEAIQFIKTLIETKLGAILAFWNKWGDDILSALQGIWSGALKVIEGALNVIRGIIKVATGLITGDWGKAWEGVKQILSGAWTAIQGIIKVAWSAVKGILTVGYGELKAVFVNGWNTLKQAVSAGITGAVELVRGFPGKAKSAMGNLASALYSAGRDLLQGLINGITSKVQGAVNAVRNAVGDVISGAKGMLGISSPSKVFKEIGRFTVQGLELGLAKTDGVKKQASQLARAVEAGFEAPQLSLASATAAYGTTGSAGRNYNITVNAPVGSSPAEIGRTLVNHIKEYERVGGRA